MLLLLLGIALAGPDDGSFGSRPAAARTSERPLSGGVVTLGTPTVSGRLAVEGVEEVVGRYASQLHYCYERDRVSNPTLGGEMTVGFVVGKDGAVSNVTITGSTVGSPRVEACIAGRFERMRFRSPKGGTVASVAWRLVLSPPER